jgi:Tol biopolymer transport system component
VLSTRQSYRGGGSRSRAKTPIAVNRMCRRFVTRLAAAVAGLAILFVGVSAPVAASRPSGGSSYHGGSRGLIGWNAGRGDVSPSASSSRENHNLSQIDAVGLDGQQVNLGGNPGGVSDGPASLSPDHATIVFERGRDLWLMNADGSGQQQVFAPPPGESLAGAGFAAPWSPDGTKLAIRLWDTARGGEWWLIDTDGSGQRLLLSPAADEDLISASSTPAWSADGSRLALEAYRTCYTNGGADTCPQVGYSVIVDVDANRLGMAGLYPAWSPDGSEIASETGGRCVVFGDATGRPVGWNPRALGLAPGDCPLPVWSPDGRWLAAESGRGSLYLVPRHGGKAHRVSADASELSWSPDGSRLAFWRGDALFLARGDGTHAYRLARHANVDSLWWTPTGSWLAFTNVYRLYVATRGGAHVRALANDTDIPGLGAVNWSASGRWLAYVSGRNGQIAVVARSGGPPRYLTNEPAGSQLSLLGWSRDGKHILYTVGTGNA